MAPKKRATRGKHVVDSGEDFVTSASSVRRTRAKLNFTGEGSRGANKDGCGEVSSRAKNDGISTEGDSDAFVTSLGECVPLDVVNGKVYPPGRMRNHPRNRYSELEFNGLLSHAPAGEEVLLREMSFEKMTYEGMTQIFRVSFPVDLAVSVNIVNIRISVNVRN